MLDHILAMGGLNGEFISMFAIIGEVGNLLAAGAGITFIDIKVVFGLFGSRSLITDSSI